MKDLLKFEFRKLRIQKSFYIILGLIFLMFLLQYVSDKALMEGLGATFNGEPEYLVLDTVPGSVIFMFLSAIFVAIVVCEDFTQQIVKNVYSKGYAREKVFLAKYIYVLACETAIFVCTLLFSYLLNGFIFAFENLTAKKIGLLLCQYVVVIANVTLYFLICALFKKIGTAIILNLLFSEIVSLFLGLIETLVIWHTELKEFPIGKYWLESFLYPLSDLNVTGGRVAECVIGSVIYIAIFLVLGIFINRKHEV